MSPSRCPIPPTFPHCRADRRDSTDHPLTRPLSRIHRLLPSLGLASLLAGCGVVIEIPLDPTSDGNTDTDTTAESDTSEGLDTGSSGCETDCTTGTDTDAEDTTGSVPPPGESHCVIPHLIASGGTATDMQQIDVPGTISDMHVLVRVTRHDISELAITLQYGEDGEPLTLLSEPNCNESHVDAIFDDDATEYANDTCSDEGSAIFGAVMPDTPLMSVEGFGNDHPAAGEWYLSISAPVDPNDPENLVLESWCIAMATEGAVLE